MKPTCKRCLKLGHGCWQHPGGKAEKPPPDTLGPTGRKSRACPACNKSRSAAHWARWEAHQGPPPGPKDPICPGCGYRRCIYLTTGSGRTARCKNVPIPGGTTCLKHGSNRPDAIKSGRQRLQEMVDPALSIISAGLTDAEKQVREGKPNLSYHPGVQRLILTVLDRAGYGAVSKVELEQLEARVTEAQGAAIGRIVDRAVELILGGAAPALAKAQAVSEESEGKLRG